MAGKYADEKNWKEKIILDEIARHERAYANAQERHGYSVSRSPEETMHKHDVLANALSVYLNSDRTISDMRNKLLDIQDFVNSELKRIDEGWIDQNPRRILETVKRIVLREV